MKDQNRFLTNLAKSPILWGGIVSVGFYTLLQIAVLVCSRMPNNGAGSSLGAVVKLCQDYFAGHEVEYATTVFFFIGLAALVVKGLELFQQNWRHERTALLLGPIAPGGQPVEDAGRLLARLDSLPKGRRNVLLVERLREILDRVHCRRSAEGLEDELKFLADRDTDRLHESYALFRVVIWAIPVLGFLGTVIGITMALAELSPTAIEDSMPLTIAALSIAFATTAQALSLSIVLMFAKYLIGQFENRLYAKVDRWADEEMLGRFEQVASGAEGQLAAVRRMSETMIDAAEHLVGRQTELWRGSIDVSEKRWTSLAREAEEQLGKAMAVALHQSLKTHAETLVGAEKEMAARNHKHWQQVQETLARSAQAAAALQSEVNQQTEMLRRTVEATGQVAKLEETLNRNLGALAGARNFEQTVMSLAAAIHLLNGRLEELPGGRAEVELQPKKRSAGQAA